MCSNFRISVHYINCLFFKSYTNIVNVRSPLHKTKGIDNNISNSTLPDEEATIFIKRFSYY